MPTFNAEYVDPFTGSARYAPGNSGNLSNFTQSGNNSDPFTGMLCILKQMQSKFNKLMLKEG